MSAPSVATFLAMTFHHFSNPFNQNKMKKKLLLTFTATILFSFAHAQFGEAFQKTLSGY